MEKNMESKTKYYASRIKNGFDTLTSSDIIFPLLFIAYALLLEVVGTLWLGLSIIPKYFALDFGIVLMLAGIIFLVQNKKIKIGLFFFFLSLPIILNCVNACLYKIFGDIFYFSLIALMGETASVFSLEYLDLYAILLHIVILGIMIASIVYVNKRIGKPNHKQIHKRLSIVLCLFILIQTCGLSSVYFTRNNLHDVSAESALYIAESDKYLYENLNLKMKSYETFGLWGFYTKELINYIDGLFPDNLTSSERVDLTKFVNEGLTEKNTNATLYGDNLIVIMCESLEWFAIDPIFTPTLYEFFHGNKTVKLTNYYSKHKTNVSEGVGIMGNMPSSITLGRCVDTNGLYAPYSLPSLFKADGVDTANYFHSFIGSFYERNKINKEIGFDDVVTIEDVDVGYKANNWGSLSSDTDFLCEVIHQLAPTDGRRFMSFYTTIKTHGQYYGHNEHLENQWDKFNNEELYAQFLLWNNANTEYKIPKKGTQNFEFFSNYKVAAMDLDSCLNLLQTHLRENGLQDSTTVVLYSDHNAYINDLSYTINGYDHDAFDSTPYNVPCAIYNSKLNGQNYTNYANVYDLFPTICELYGLPYNKSLTHGYNIFSEEIKNSLTVSYICGIFTDKLYSRDIENVYKCTDDEISDEEIYQFKVNASKFYYKQNLIDRIYETNFLKELK